MFCANIRKTIVIGDCALEYVRRNASKNVADYATRLHKKTLHRQMQQCFSMIIGGIMLNLC